jgi:hypothetical protein
MDISRNDIASLAQLIAEQVKTDTLASATPGRWLTYTEAMLYAKVRSRDTMRKWIDNGYIYAHKRSGQWIIDRQSIDDWFLSEKVIVEPE